MLYSSLGTYTSDEVASAVATCGREMRQLRKLSITYIDPLPLLRALGDRDCPLEHVTVEDPLTAKAMGASFLLSSMCLFPLITHSSDTLTAHLTLAICRSGSLHTVVKGWAILINIVPWCFLKNVVIILHTNYWSS